MNLDFSKYHVLVIGDIMLDRYIYGDNTRKSPEADVPIIDQTSKEEKLGGAANVALNILGLGAKASLIGVAGNDHYGDLLLHLIKNDFDQNAHVIIEEKRKTTCKTRIISNNLHIARIDHESLDDIQPTTQNLLILELERILANNDIDIVILQDYNKGIFNSKTLPLILSQIKQKGIPYIVDPKNSNFFDFKNAHLFKPNLKEMQNAFKSNIIELKELKDYSRKMRQMMKSKINLITLGANGLFIEDGKTFLHFSGIQIEQPDVCGAGDSVIAICALLIPQQISLEHLGKMCNLIGYASCLETGVNAINLEKLDKISASLYQDIKIKYL